MSILQKWFAKKPNEKAVKQFWKELEARADLYLDILEREPEDGEDYVWMMNLVRKSLRLCCLDASIGFSFRFENNRDPVRFVFVHNRDEYLKQVAERLQANYPPALAGKIDFAFAAD